MRVLVDSSVWIDYFQGKSNTQKLSLLLEEDRVVVHPWIILELALGHLGKNRDQILSDLRLFCVNDVWCSDDELYQFIVDEKLSGTGLSFVDTVLLHSCLITDQMIWTHDKALNKMAMRYKRSFSLSV